MLYEVITMEIIITKLHAGGKFNALVIPEIRILYFDKDFLLPRAQLVESQSDFGFVEKLSFDIRRASIREKNFHRNNFV